MSILHRPPLDEAPPVVLPRAVPATTRRPLPLGAPARSVAVLRELRAEAPVSRAAADHHRYDPNRLLPRTAVVRRVSPARVLRDDIDTVTADLAAAFAARPGLRHEPALLMALTPVVAMLKAGC